MMDSTLPAAPSSFYRPDWGLVRKHAWILLPLAATQFLQRFEHVVDNRFISMLGQDALVIHSVNYNFFLAAQAIGLAASTSALIFWKRQESREKQHSILEVHVRAAALAAGVVALAALPLLGLLVRSYGIDSAHASSARYYLGIGLVNMVLAAAYAPINALLIASDQRMQSVVNVTAILIIKIAAGLLALKAASSGGLTAPLLIIGLGGAAAIFGLSAAAWVSVRRHSTGGLPFAFAEMSSVWKSELGTAAIRSASPFLYSYFLARSAGGSSLMVTYQLTLHMAYILSLPQLAGTQLAVRDASEEYSRQTAPGALLGSEWFRWFFAVSVLPTQFLLLCGAALASPIMLLAYGYRVPAEHLPFLGLYFIACAVGQVGNVFMIVLRTLRKNEIGTRNFFIAEIGVMVMATGTAVHLGVASPVALGLIVFAYCAAYLGLNWSSVRAVRIKATA